MRFLWIGTREKRSKLPHVQRTALRPSFPNIQSILHHILSTTFFLFRAIGLKHNVVRDTIHELWHYYSFSLEVAMKWDGAKNVWYKKFIYLSVYLFLLYLNKNELWISLKFPPIFSKPIYYLFWYILRRMNMQKYSLHCCFVLLWTYRRRAQQHQQQQQAQSTDSRGKMFRSRRSMNL